SGGAHEAAALTGRQPRPLRYTCRMAVDIRAILPHRYPFLMVDRFVSQSGDSFECIKNVTHNEPYFVGHFPDEPVMPGVLIVEALAQAAAVGLAVREGETDGGAVGYLTTV